MMIPRPIEGEKVAAKRDWSIITVTYNSGRALERYWGSFELPDNAEWIVVDNGSSDDSVRVAASLGARVIELEKNIGFGAANNVGFHASSSPFVAFVNPDVTVRSDSLGPLREILERTDALVSPQLANPDGSLQPNGRGYPFLLWKIINRTAGGEKNKGYQRIATAAEELPVVWFMGATVLGRRDVLSRLGPWDERFFVYYEDSDLGLRALRAGIDRILVGEQVWIHGWARETRTLRLSAWKLELPSMLKFYSRYPRLLSLWPTRTSMKMVRANWPSRRGSRDDRRVRAVRPPTTTDNRKG